MNRRRIIRRGAKMESKSFQRLWEAGGESRRRTVESEKMYGYKVSWSDSRLGVSEGSVNALRVELGS